MWTREAEFRERLDRMVTSPTRSGLAELSDLAVDDQKWCYKHVSALLQRAYHRAKKRSKVHVLYALSAIVRKSKERLAAKDQYASRLEPILLELSPSLAELERKQQAQIERLIQTWEREEVFSEGLLSTLSVEMTLPSVAASQPAASPLAAIEDAGIASPFVLPAKQQSRDNALGVSLPAEQHAGAPGASSSHGAASTSTGLAKPPALEPPLKPAATPTSSASSKHASSMHAGELMYDPFQHGDSPSPSSHLPPPPPLPSTAAQPPPPPAPPAAAQHDAPYKRQRRSRWEPALTDASTEAAAQTHAERAPQAGLQAVSVGSIAAAAAEAAAAAHDLGYRRGSDGQAAHAGQAGAPVGAQPFGRAPHALHGTSAPPPFLTAPPPLPPGPPPRP